MDGEFVSSPDLSLHLLGDEGVLFDAAKQVVFSTNTTATYILCSLQEGMSPRDVATDLSDRFGLAPATAERYVDSVARQDFADGISLAGDSGPPLFEPRGEAVGRLGSPAVVRQYRLLDGGFRLHYADMRLFDWVGPVLGHFEEPAGTGTSIIDLFVVPHGEGYAILEQGLVLETCRSLAAVAAMVKACLVYRALKRAGDFCALHAGAVLVPGSNQCLLLPGASGRGKSTLVAGLAASGFAMLADDTTVVTDLDFTVRPLPCAIAVKAGAWDVLAPHYPELIDAPLHHRPDGLAVRYLLPGTLAAKEVRAPIGKIVFPQFDPTAVTALSPVAKSEALRRLMGCFLPLRGKLSKEDVGRLVDWIDQTPAYDLRLSSLEEAVDAVAGLYR
jgi:hypothetical protein